MLHLCRNLLTASRLISLFGLEEIGEMTSGHLETSTTLRLQFTCFKTHCNCFCSFVCCFLVLFFNREQRSDTVHPSSCCCCFIPEQRQDILYLSAKVSRGWPQLTRDFKINQIQISVSQIPFLVARIQAIVQSNPWG